MEPQDTKKPADDQPSHLRKLRILVAPLDWGLGHATRCIPIIHQLISHNCEVFIAAEGAQEALLRHEFPDVAFFPLQGYRIRYGRSSRGSVWKIIRQVPRMMSTIRKEHTWLRQMIDSHRFDAVISDNRYGVWSSKVPSVFITHQLRISSPFGRWSDSHLLRWNMKQVNRFSECWIPDEEGVENLAGQLCHPIPEMRKPVHYLGILSRFRRSEYLEKKGHLLIILSGPEPQRTLLENIIIRDIAHYPGSATIVRGLPSSEKIIPSTNSIKVYNHLSAAELETHFQAAEYVIARSGYSTIMDIATMGKKSILVPTPGQTEQEYLAEYVSGKKRALYLRQHNFQLSEALHLAEQFGYQPWPVSAGNLQATIERFLLSLR